MNKCVFLFSTLLLTFQIQAATTIDTNGTWDGGINGAGHLGSGQSFTVGAVDTKLDSIGFYFGQQSDGLTFQFTISDQIGSGTSFYTTSALISEGFNSFNVNLSLTGGNEYFAWFDYNGYSDGGTAHYSNVDGYAGGHSYFFSSATWHESFTSLDHRFIAEFSDGRAGMGEAGGGGYVDGGGEGGRAGMCSAGSYDSYGGETCTPSAVPIPAAAFMFAPALLGFLGLRRKAKNTVA